MIIILENIQDRICMNDLMKEIEEKALDAYYPEIYNALYINRDIPKKEEPQD